MPNILTGAKLCKENKQNYLQQQKLLTNGKIFEKMLKSLQESWNEMPINFRNNCQKNL